MPLAKQTQDRLHKFFEELRGAQHVEEGIRRELDKLDEQRRQTALLEIQRLSRTEDPDAALRSS